MLSRGRLMERREYSLWTVERCGIMESALIEIYSKVMVRGIAASICQPVKR